MKFLFLVHVPCPLDGTLHFHMTIEDMRRNYQHATLNLEDVDPDPIAQFRLWFEQAVEVNTGDWFEPNAMTLATATPDGVPSARVVLLKDIDDDGIVFYTNYASQKGREIAANPKAAAVFHWPTLERQVRIAGRIEKVRRERSEQYFHKRPRGSQFGAMVSNQSDVVPTREILEEDLSQLERTYGEEDVIPLPENWGGYKLLVEELELWQGRPNRLHDRIRYRLDGDTYVMERLAP